MAAAVVSGATALLLEANPALTPADAKLLLQVTSSPVSGAGLIEAGAGSVNVAAAVALSRSPMIRSVETTIGGEGFLGMRLESSGTPPSTANPASFWCGVVSLRWWDTPPVSDTLLGSRSSLGSGLVWGNGLVSATSWSGEASPLASDILVWGTQLRRTFWFGETSWFGVVKTVNADILVWGNGLVWGNYLLGD